jgi:hypothetical protein
LMHFDFEMLISNCDLIVINSVNEGFKFIQNC